MKARKQNTKYTGKSNKKKRYHFEEDIEEHQSSKSKNIRIKKNNSKKGKIKKEENKINMNEDKALCLFRCWLLEYNRLKIKLDEIRYFILTTALHYDKTPEIIEHIVVKRVAKNEVIYEAFVKCDEDFRKSCQ